MQVSWIESHIFVVVCCVDFGHRTNQAQLTLPLNLLFSPPGLTRLSEGQLGSLDVSCRPWWDSPLLSLISKLLSPGRKAKTLPCCTFTRLQMRAHTWIPRMLATPKSLCMFSQLYLCNCLGINRAFQFCVHHSVLLILNIYKPNLPTHEDPKALTTALHHPDMLDYPFVIGWLGRKSESCK